mgnify:CR=1 FL=1
MNNGLVAAALPIAYTWYCPQIFSLPSSSHSWLPIQGTSGMLKSIAPVADRTLAVRSERRRRNYQVSPSFGFFCFGGIGNGKMEMVRP